MNFDPDNFLSTDVAGANSTEYTPVPEGEYPAIIKGIKPRVTDSGRTIADVTWGIQDDKAAEVTGMKEPSVRQSIFLDIDDNGTLSLAKGKNVQLGKLRAAVGQNDPSKPWNFRMLEGQMAKVLVKHRMDGETLYTDVKAVTKL